MPLYTRKAVPGEILQTSQGSYVKVHKLVESSRSELGYVIRCSYIGDGEHFSGDTITFDPVDMYYIDKVDKYPIYEIDTSIKSNNITKSAFKSERRDYININFNF